MILDIIGYTLKIKEINNFRKIYFFTLRRLYIMQDNKNSVLSRVSSKLTSGIKSVTDTAKKTNTVVSSNVESVKKSPSIGFILVAFIIGLVILFIAYYLFVFFSRKITNKQVTTISGSEGRKGLEVAKLSGGSIPESSNGKRKSMIFWMYIHDIDKFSGENFRHVFHVGDENLVGASPVVFLDGKLNKLYISFTKPEEGKSFEQAIKDIETANPGKTKADALKMYLSTHGVIVDYIPLQRWVQVAIVVNETVNAGYISVYVDGELVKTVSSNDSIQLSDGSTVEASFQQLNLDKKGNVYIGGDVRNSNMTTGFSGLVSNIVFANYDMNGKEIRKYYHDGPINSITGKLGLGNYGVRTPVYRIL